jgi:hypothetical protein
VIDPVLRFGDKTLLRFALIAAGVAAVLALASTLDRGDDAGQIAGLERPLPALSRDETKPALTQLEGLSMFEDVMAREREAAQAAAGGDAPDTGPIAGVIPRPFAIVVKDGQITAYAFGGISFAEGDVVSGYRVERLGLSEILFRSEDGAEEEILLFGRSVPGAAAGE